MDSPEGSANDAMTAEINRRVNKAVNASIRPLQDQMTQLLTALNRLIDDQIIAVEGRRKPLLDPPKFIGKRKEYAGCSSSSSKDLPQPIKDNHKCFNCNQISYIAAWCPRLKRSYPAKVKKVKKVKKAARPKESSSSTTEELGSSETEESLGKE
ncbi:hypothetical protein K456DRAFT_49727 [Colletotrichum gloeosporioides 23]|nr:hypothetical protein K456DRAFT_49727 [Colletotrichum gloeosporioides 23]